MNARPTRFVGAAQAGRATGAGQLLRRFALEEDGQDLVEYGLLAAFIGVAGYLVLQAIGGEIFRTYSSWLDPTSGVPSRWDPPDPVSAGS